MVAEVVLTAVEDVVVGYDDPGVNVPGVVAEVLITVVEGLVD